MRIALAQLNPIVGDIGGNTERILAAIDQARTQDAVVALFPELAVFGYPPKDLVLRKELIEANLRAVDRIASACRGLTAVVGFVKPDPSGRGKGIFNAAAVCRDGSITGTYAKMLLPTYDVFDEARYFNPGADVTRFTVGERRVAISICEDLWNDHQFEGRRVYNRDPVAQSVQAGAQVLLNLSASPYRADTQGRRETLFAAQAREHRVPLFCVNQVGGNDDLIFDGASLAMDANGTVVARCRAFEEDLVVVDFDGDRPSRIEPYPDRIPAMRGALVLGVRDYLRKCSFDSVVIGLSGGVDSAVTAAIAVEAVGADRTLGVAMPSRFSSEHSLADARALADRLGIRLTVIPIEQAHLAMEQSLADEFARVARSGETTTDENIQARIRGNILMALSNQAGSLLLTTGNKSELAVGYCTLYGDMCGGLAVLSDVPKTSVYALARDINRTAGRPVIPQRTIDKPPSAELRPNQRDDDSLPPYDVLDAILERYVEREQSVAAIVEAGFDVETVERVASMVDRNEYKRKQAAVGLKVTSRAFGTGRRMPIAARHHMPRPAQS